MTDLVEVGAAVVAAMHAGAGALGAWRWYEVRPSATFWIVLRAAQAAAVAFAALVGGLAAAGRTADDGLFYVYALLPVAVAAIAEQLRVASAETVLEARGLSSAQDVGRLPEDRQRSVVLAIVRREIGVMALAALVVAFLAVRAWGTAGGI